MNIGKNIGEKTPHRRDVVCNWAGTDTPCEHPHCDCPDTGLPYCTLCGSDDRICRHPRCPHAHSTRLAELPVDDGAARRKSEAAMLQRVEAPHTALLKKHPLYCRFCKSVVSSACKDRTHFNVCPIAADAKHYMDTGESRIDRILREQKANCIQENTKRTK